MRLPDKLYKYESFTIQSLLNLKTQTVYFSPPSGFNDPYDCGLKAQLKDPTTSDIEKLREKYLAKDWPNDVIKKIKSASLEQLKPTLIRAARQANEQIIEEFISTRGVSCFSEVNDELLMWAHYADKYTGFCLEFKTDNELFEKARKVHYVDKIPKLDIQSIYAEGDRDEMLDLFCTKSKSWEYESEWRVIHGNAGTAYTYPVEALTGVYFGPNMPFEVFEVICLVLQGQNSHVKFWQGKRSDTNFKVEFEKVNYTSHIISKKSGVST